MTITLSTVVVADSQNGFSDITEDSPHYEAIMALSQDGIINGYADGTFKQWETVTRSQAAVILYNTLNMRTLTNLDDILNQYDDIDRESRYANEIAAVTYAGIFKGNQGKFRPYEPLSRQQMASILVNAFDLSDEEITEDVDIFLDNVSDSHKDSVQTIANLGITNRLDDYRPRENTSRGAFATMLHLVITFIEDESEHEEKIGKAKKKLPNPLLANGDEISVQNSETALGNLIADSMLASALKEYENAVIALQYSGDIETGMDKGPITTGDVLAVLPSEKSLVSMELSGEEILKVLEESVSQVPKESPGFLQVAGMQFEFDSSEKPGERIEKVNVKKGDVYFELDTDANYTVVTDSETASGMNGFEVLAQVEKNSIGISNVESLHQMIKQLGAVDYDVEGRIVNLAEPSDSYQ